MVLIGLGPVRLRSFSGHITGLPNTKDNDGDKVPSHHAECNWPKEAHYVPAPPGKRPIQIGQQLEPISNVIWAAIRLSQGDVLFINAYLAGPGKTIKAYYSLSLQKCAKNMKLNAVSDRLNQDPIFANASGCVVSLCLLTISTSE